MHALGLTEETHANTGTAGKVLTESSHYQS